MFARIRFFDTQIFSNYKTKLDCEEKPIYLNWFQFNKNRLIKCDRNITMNRWIGFLFEYPHFYTPIYQIYSNYSLKKCTAHPELRDLFAWNPFSVLSNPTWRRRDDGKYRNLIFNSKLKKWICLHQRYEDSDGLFVLLLFVVNPKYILTLMCI